MGHFALLDLEPYLDSQSGSNRQWLSRCYGKAWPSQPHQERSRDCNVSAGNRTRVSTGGGEHLAKSYSNSILLAIWNIYIWFRNNQCRNDPKSRIRIRNIRSGSTKLKYCLRRKIRSHPIYYTLVSNFNEFYSEYYDYLPWCPWFLLVLWIMNDLFWIQMWPWKIGEPKNHQDITVNSKQ